MVGVEVFPDPRCQLRGEIRIDHEGCGLETDNSDHERRDQRGRPKESNPFIEVQPTEVQRVFMVNIRLVHRNLPPPRLREMAYTITGVGIHPNMCDSNVRSLQGAARMRAAVSPEE